ncbi:MAG: ANTAR domain-containing protein [Eubacteriales bacterium]|nr:ANTAR domain-containing protein [Eubacteriales bacterium]
MECIVVAFPKRETAEKIAEIIRKNGLDIEIMIHHSASGVLSETQLADAGVVICTERIQGMSYTELFDYLPRNFHMIMISKRTDLESGDDRLKLLTSPFQIQLLLKLVTDSLAERKKTERKKKQIKIQRTPQEQKMIDQAKEILMKLHGIDEPEAHAMLQKQSMDYHRSMVESAQMILLLQSGEW